MQLVTEDATALPAWFLEQVTELRMDMGRSALPWDFLMHAPRLEVLHLTAHSLRSLPEGFLAHAPSLESFRLDAGDVARFSNLSSFPEGFLTHAPSLVELRLRVPALQTFPPSFLGHVPRLETLELETTKHHPSIYREILPVMSLPANFLIHAPRLRHLDLEPLGHVKAFPPGFLSGSPQLRYLNLDANEATALPADFLSQHPHLETVRLRANHIPALPRGFLSQSPRLTDLKLDLQRVEALPEGFLADTPRLWNLGLDVHGVEALPPGFLADAPHLTRLNLRARNLTAWPADFLADAPRLRSLGLAMPLLEPTLTPDHRLWETLQATSLRVKVTRSTVLDPDPCQWHVKPGAILEVEGRTRDDRGRRLLRWMEAYPPGRNGNSFRPGGTCPTLSMSTAVCSCLMPGLRSRLWRSAPPTGTRRSASQRRNGWRRPIPNGAVSPNGAAVERQPRVSGSTGGCPRPSPNWSGRATAGRHSGGVFGTWPTTGAEA